MLSDERRAGQTSGRLIVIGGTPRNRVTESSASTAPKRRIDGTVVDRHTEQSRDVS